MSAAAQRAPRQQNFVSPLLLRVKVIFHEPFPHTPGTTVPFATRPISAAAPRTMSYQLYRNTTLGNTLQESLDELIQYGQITPQLAIKVLLQFDKAINQALATRVKSRLTFKAGKLNTYRFCDNVWTFMLNDVEFREVQEIAMVDKVKIVACDGKTLDADAAAKR